MKSLSIVFLTAFTCLLLCGTATQAVPLIYNTGVDANGAVLPDLSVDPHYTFNSTALVESTISATPASNTLSSWIRPATYLGPGTYSAFTSFAYPTAGVPITITGRWSATTTGLGISLNSQANGTFTTPNPGNLVWTSFSLTGTTLAGTNTLAFQPFSNGTPPVGLRVEIESVVVPEPTSIATIVIPFALGLRRRHLRGA